MSRVFLSGLALAASSWPVWAVGQLRRPCGETVSIHAARLVPALQAFGAALDSAPLAVRVCGVADRYAITVQAPRRDRAKDYGPRLVVLAARAGKAARIVYATPGMMDTFRPELYAFPAADRTLLLADLGDEGSWGFAPFEVTAAGTRELSLLDVGLPAAGPGGDPDASAIRHARASWAHGTWVVHFDTTVVLRPNQGSDRRVLRGSPGGVTFELVRGTWRHVP